MYAISIAMFAAGAIGGILGIMLSGTGFVKPGWVDPSNKTTFQFGWIREVFIGALASMLFSWMYTPLSNIIVFSQGESSGAQLSTDPINLSLNVLAVGVFIGIGGSAWFADHSSLTRDREALLGALGTKDPTIASNLRSAKKGEIHKLL